MTQELRSLDPDQDRHSVGPDLSPNCLHMLIAEDMHKSLQAVSNNGANKLE